MLEDPWAVPSSCAAVRLRRSTDGSVPRLATTVSAYYDDRYLNVVFSCADDYVEATLLDHDAPIFEEDVVEVFLAPGSPAEYYEIDVSPMGTVFDARVESPDGVRETMTADAGWDCAGLLTGVRRLVEANGSVIVDTTIRIPFRGLRRGPPGDGEVWRANFFRVDRNPSAGDEYSAWRPTMKAPPDFHVVAAFGALIFRW